MADKVQSDRGDAGRWLAIMLPVATLIWGASQFIIQRADSAQKERVALVSSLSPKLMSSNLAERNAAALTISVLLKDAQERNDAALAGTLQALQSAYEPLTRAAVASADPGQLEDIAKTREALASLDAAPRPTPEAEQSGAQPAVVVEPNAATDAAAGEPGSTVLASVSLVYFQIYSEQQREAANAAAIALRSLGIGVPGIENVLSGKPDSEIERFRRFSSDLLEVRYFRADDAEAAAALARVLSRQANSPVIRTRQVILRGTSVRAGQLEVWYPWSAPRAPASAAPGQ